MNRSRGREKGGGVPSFGVSTQVAPSKRSARAARGPLEKTYCDRAMLVGDAAGFVSPVTGDGINYAIESGRMAAHALAEKLEEDKLDESGMKRYQDMWMEKWGGDFDALCDIADQIMKNSDRIVKVAMKDTMAAPSQWTSINRLPLFLIMRLLIGP